MQAVLVAVDKAILEQALAVLELLDKALEAGTCLMTITAAAAGVLRKLAQVVTILMVVMALQLSQLGVRQQLLVKTSVALAGSQVAAVAIIEVQRMA